MNIKIVMTPEEREQAFQVRLEVFVHEQKVPKEIELDEFDDTAMHFLALDNHKPIAASRLRFVEEYGKLERICVLKGYRGKSIGKALIQAMEVEIKEKGYKKAKLNAQIHAVEFYSKLGYETVSDEFMDAGIPHVTMIKAL
ncbi:GNAT family N-acetyltransferase [Oceanobacillus piezotolerans]|uniref:GNAT family N-acetyltransferase n=1 Tax=Oceanobacillus piezotolerans TaxID=2448030 RepID=A0A498D8X8_9BACI|nr:GNAT family N-acetyltransferase [Oceanobacillus piezotolerans]RLL45081.1 GNAT family N-acetyltransferase [Oceanobacillus piezotolerans]